MAEMIFAGPEGRLEADYQRGRGETPPVALILSPHPLFGGTMNNRICFELFNLFARRGFSTMRFNFRGVGRSVGEYDQGQGELADAATALDYLQHLNPNSPFAWVGGMSFGAWIGMQLLMRRPEIVGFISAAVAPNLFDFTFLAPCPSSGIVIHGAEDRICPPEETRQMVARTRTQKGRRIRMDVLEGADHFMEGNVPGFVELAEGYLDMRLAWPTPEGPLDL